MAPKAHVTYLAAEAARGPHESSQGAQTLEFFIIFDSQELLEAFKNASFGAVANGAAASKACLSRNGCQLASTRFEVGFGMILMKR